MADLDRRILDASADLIAEQGVRNVSFREVARRAGVSHQMPYHIFKNLQGILTALAKEGFGTLAANMNAAAEKETDAGARLKAAGFAYVDFAQTHVGHFRVMFQKSLVDVQDPEHPLEEAECTHGTLVRLATEAVEAGYGRGLSAEAMSALAWSTAHGIATLMIEGTMPDRGPVPEDPSEVARDVVRALAHLL